MTHTPGPWHDDGYRIYAPVHADGTPLAPGEDPRNGRMIVEYKHVDGFNPDDGPLLASVPDLLSAARIGASMLALEARLHRDNGRADKTEAIEAAAEHISAIIAKAEGRTAPK